MKEEIKIWEQQQDENSKQYEAFLMYLNMEPTERSLRKVSLMRRRADSTQKKKQRSDEEVTTLKAPDRIVSKWSSLFNWVKRVEAYDAHMKKRRQKIREAQIDRIGDKALDVIEALLDVNLSDLFNFKGKQIRLKSFEEMSEQARAVIKKIKIDSRGAEIDLLDKLSAAKEAAKLAGLFERDNEQRVPSDLSFNIVVNGEEKEV